MLQPPLESAPALPPSGGGIASLELRHAGDTPTQRFAWRKTPTATSIERAAGAGGPGWGAGRWRTPGNCTHGRAPRRNKSRPTRTTPRRFGTKLSPHTPSHRMSGTKLSLLARNGSIWRFFYMQGEFYTVVTTKKPSRENFVPYARQRWGSPTQQHTRPHLCGGYRRIRRARAGFEAQSLAAAPRE